MKLLPILYNNNANVLSAKKYLASTLNSPAEDTKRPRSLYTYRPVNFKGIDTIAFIGDLKSLNDMHCPLCGTKMLSQKESQSAMAEADKVKTPEELCGYLEKYNESINPEFKTVIKDSKLKFYKNTNPDINSFLESLHNDYYKKSNHTIEKTFETIDGFINDNSLNQHDKDLLLKCRKEFADISNNKSHKQIMKRFTNTLKETVAFLQSEDKNKIYTQIFKPLRQSFKVEFLFSTKLGDSKPEDTKQKTFLRNLLYYSHSDIHKVNNKMFSDSDNVTNMMLSCENCSIEHNSIFRLNDTSSRQHFYKHTSELSEQALRGNLESNKTYPLNLIALVRKLSNNKINPDYNDISIKKLSETTGVKNNKETDFELVNIENMPCCTCGQRTITHEEKCEIYDKIKYADNLSQITDLFKENLEIIKPKYLALTERFIYETEKDPSIDETTLLQNLKDYQHEYIEELLYDFTFDIREAEDKYKFSEKDKNLATKFIASVDQIALEQTPDKVFDYKSYYEMLKETVGQMDSYWEPELFNRLKIPARDAYLSQLILFPEKEVTQKVGTEIRVLAQDIFKNSVAAKTKLDSDKDNNDVYRMPKKSDYAVMCRSCLNEKKRKKLPLWVELHPEIQQNFSKYLRHAGAEIEKRGLKSYKFYPLEMAENARKLSDGKLNVSLNSI